MNEKNKKTCKYLHYLEHWPILVSTITDCVANSAFPSLVYIPVGIIICAITAGITKSIIKKKKKKHDKIILLGKDKLVMK